MELSALQITEFIMYVLWLFSNCGDVCTFFSEEKEELEKEKCSPDTNQDYNFGEIIQR